MGVLQQPGAVGLLLRAQHGRSPRPAAGPARRRRRGSSPGPAARRSATRSGTRTAARPGRPPRRCSAAGTAARSSRYSSPRRRRAATPAPSRRSPARTRAAPRARRSSCANDERTEPFSASQFQPPSVELLAEQPGDDAVDVHAEVGADRDGPPVDARLDLAGEERLPGVLPPAVLAAPARSVSRTGAASGSMPKSRSSVRVGKRRGPGLALRRSRRGSRPGSTRRRPTGRRRRAARAAGRPSPRSRRAPARPRPRRAARRSRSRSTCQRSAGSESSSQSRTVMNRR